jgi:transposase
MATRAEWSKRVERWRRSGLTADRFATREGLRLSSLYWWSSHLQRVATPPVVEVIGLASQTEPSSTSFEVVLPNGTRVIAPAEFRSEDLRRLLTALELR